jgi:hypothetical protein
VVKQTGHDLYGDKKYANKSEEMYPRTNGGDTLDTNLETANHYSIA